MNTDMITIILASIVVLETLLIGVSAYLIVNLNRKSLIYEAWLLKYRTKLDDVYAQLKSVDERNLFDRDDDVGFVFSELVRIMSEFDKEMK